MACAVGPCRESIVCVAKGMREGGSATSARTIARCMQRWTVLNVVMVKSSRACHALWGQRDGPIVDWLDECGLEFDVHSSIAICYWPFTTDPSEMFMLLHFCHDLHSNTDVTRYVSMVVYFTHRPRCIDWVLPECLRRPRGVTPRRSLWYILREEGVRPVKHALSC